MSDDRLEKGLEALRNETASPEQLDQARARVWQKLENHGMAACAEFQPAFREYLDGRLVDHRRLLMEDHLSRCPQCRAQLAELRGDKTVVAMPRRHAWWPQWGKWALAAAALLIGLYLGRGRLDQWLAPAGPRATVASLSGAMYRIPQGALQPGAGIAEGETVRTGPEARALLRLADGSVVEVNQGTELFINAAWSGQTIHLQRGDIIVQAAKQRRGHLRVQTRDSVASVKGTVFAVSSGLAGTLVSVVEGAVAVARAGSPDVVLNPGQQASSNAGLTSSVEEAVSWSPDAQTYIALLESFAKIDKQLAQLPHPALRTEPRLLKCLTPNATVYVALPNLGGTITQTMALFEQQAAESQIFRTWWNSASGTELKLIIERIQKVTPLLGDEIVFTLSAPDATSHPIPALLAEVQPGKRSELVSAIDALHPEGAATPMPYSVNDTLLVASDSQADLQWIIGNLGQGASTQFAQAIAARYQRGAGWLVGMDAATTISAKMPDVGQEFTGAGNIRHMFFEQRAIQGVEQNEVTLTFQGPRMGMASWLANTGSGGAAEYLSADAALAVYAATREPGQLFEEVTLLSNAQIALAQAESQLGIGFAKSLAAAVGTESAFALEGFGVTGPAWMMAMLANDPAVIDASVRKLVDVYNGEVAASDPLKKITIEQETVDGRVWTTLKPGILPVAITWTYDRGYLVAGSDRGIAARAIATRNGGSPLVWSPAFQQQLPSSSGLHPAGFVWLNTKGIFQSLAMLVQNAAIQKLLAERDPILVAFDGSSEQIHAASRVRISGLIIDMMRLEGLGRAASGILQ